MFASSRCFTATGVPLLGVRVHDGGDSDVVVRWFSVHGLLRNDPREFGDFVRRERGKTCFESAHILKKRK